MSIRIKPLLREVVVRSLLGLDRISRERGIPILQYHRVSQHIGPDDVHSIRPSEFSSHMNWLGQHGYRAVALSDVVNYIDGNSGAFDHCVAITFDDGHRDNIQFAYPVLKALGLRATVFVVSDYVGRSGWIDRHGRLCSARPEGGQRWELLSWDELASMRDVFDVGVHGKTHASLPSLSQKGIEVEVNESRQAVFDHLGTWPAFFCYPFGATNKVVVDLVRAAGCKGACGVEKGLNTVTTNPWLLGRNIVGRDISRAQFGLLLSGHARTYEKISNWVNQRQRR